MKNENANLNQSPALKLKSSIDWKAIYSEPYRLLFPFGMFNAAIGIGLWIPYYFWPLKFSYPGQGHAAIQIQGFLLCFIFGFLTTMLPKILGIRPLDPITFFAFPISIFGILSASLAGFPLIAQSFHLLILINFAGFIIRRYPSRRSNPPTQFLFIAFAIISDLIGTLIVLASLAGLLPENWIGIGLRTGANLQFQAFLLLLILGVGGFLLPKLFANGPVDPKILQAGAGSKLRRPLIVCLLFFISYGFEIFSQINNYGNIGIQLAYGLRALVWTWFLFLEIRIHKIPNRTLPYLTIARIALLLIGLGLFMPVILPNYMLAWKHIIFIGGFLPLTLAIASRVLAAHAGRLDFLSMNARSISIYGGLLALATMTRVATEIWPGAHLMHLAIASMLTLSALVIWGKIYLPMAKKFPGR